MLLIMALNDVEKSPDIYIGSSLIFSALVILCRESEKQRRKEYFLLQCTKEREKEWKRILSSLPVGIAIHSKYRNPKLGKLGSLDERHKIETQERNANPYLRKLSYCNPALKEILSVKGQNSTDNARLNSNIYSWNNETECKIDDNKQKNVEAKARIELEDIEDIRNEDEDIISKFVTESHKFREESKEEDIGEEMKYEIGGITKELKLGRVDIMFQNEESVGLIVEDLTLTHKIEREKLIQEFQSRLVRTITHEIRTPLNAINGSVEIIEQSSTPQIKQKQEIYIRTIKNAIQFLLEFVECNL